MAIKKAVLAAVGALLLSGCGYAATQKVSGTVAKLECDNVLADTHITLDNGVRYSYGSTDYCRIGEGAQITIYHDDKLRINRVVVEGSEEVTK